LRCHRLALLGQAILRSAIWDQAGWVGHRVSQTIARLIARDLR
jgi:hypothetical protein